MAQPIPLEFQTTQAAGLTQRCIAWTLEAGGVSTGKKGFVSDQFVPAAGVPFTAATTKVPQGGTVAVLLRLGGQTSNPPKVDDFALIPVTAGGPGLPELVAAGALELAKRAGYPIPAQLSRPRPPKASVASYVLAAPEGEANMTEWGRAAIERAQIKYAARLHCERDEVADLITSILLETSIDNIRVLASGLITCFVYDNKAIPVHSIVNLGNEDHRPRGRSSEEGCTMTLSVAVTMGEKFRPVHAPLASALEWRDHPDGRRWLEVFKRMLTIWTEQQDVGVSDVTGVEGGYRRLEDAIAEYDAYMEQLMLPIYRETMSTRGYTSDDLWSERFPEKLIYGRAARSMQASVDSKKSDKQCTVDLPVIPEVWRLSSYEGSPASHTGSRPDNRKRPRSRSPRPIYDLSNEELRKAARNHGGLKFDKVKGRYVCANPKDRMSDRARELMNAINTQLAQVGKERQRGVGDCHRERNSEERFLAPPRKVVAHGGVPREKARIGGRSTIGLKASLLRRWPCAGDVALRLGWLGNGSSETCPVERGGLVTSE